MIDIVGLVDNGERMPIGGRGFHVTDGWCFKREDDGAVVLSHEFDSVEEGKGSTTFRIDADAWASVIASVANQEGNDPGVLFRVAEQFHAGNLSVVGSKE